MPVHLNNYVSTLQTGIVGRAAGLHIFNDCAMNRRRDLQLIALALAEIAETQSPAAFAVFSAGVRRARRCAHRFERDRNRHALAVAQHAELDGVAGTLLPDFHLQLSGVVHRLSIEFDDNIARTQASFTAGSVGVDLVDDGSGGIFRLEELGIIRSYIRDANSNVAVADLAVLDQGLHSRLYDLRGNREAHAGERSVAGDKEGVDSDQLAARIYERSAGVTGVDGRVGLDELTGLAAIGRVGIRTVERADDAARYCELKSVGIAECQHGLSGMKLR